MDSAEMGFLLRQQLNKDLGIPDANDDLDNEPVRNVWASHGDFQLVGNGVRTDSFCGRQMRFPKGCIRTDLHKLITLDGVNYAGKVFVRRQHHWCMRPSCPVCYKSGWAVREAASMERRLKEGSKHFGKIEHIMISVPVQYYGLSLEALRVKVQKALVARGIIGGGSIYHGFRYADGEESRRKRVPFGWYWSVHFHVLGFILGGFHKCRICKFCDAKGSRYQCDGCKGFYGRSKELYKKDKFIVEVQGERKTVFGTAHYQLNHSTVKVGVKRFQVVRWFGVVSYRKLRVSREKIEELCPICRHELVDVLYSGSRDLVLCRDAPNYRRDTFEDDCENGRSVWSEVVKSKKWSSGSYDE